MSAKQLITRPDLHLREDDAGQEAFPRLFAGDTDAPPSSGGADARQPGETATRLPRILHSDPQKLICWQSFAILKSLFSPRDFSAMVSLYVLNIDLHLAQIARSRACRDFGAVVREAEGIYRIAGNLGALGARDAAYRLKQACLAADYAVTYGLISALSHACEDAEKELNAWLVSNPDQRGF